MNQQDIFGTHQNIVSIQYNKTIEIAEDFMQWLKYESEKLNMDSDDIQEIVTGLIK